MFHPDISVEYKRKYGLIQEKRIQSKYNFVIKDQNAAKQAQTDMITAYLMNTCKIQGRMIDLLCFLEDEQYDTDAIEYDVSLSDNEKSTDSNIGRIAHEFWQNLHRYFYISKCMLCQLSIILLLIHKYLAHSTQTFI